VEFEKPHHFLRCAGVVNSGSNNLHRRQTQNKLGSVGKACVPNKLSAMELGDSPGFGESESQSATGVSPGKKRVEQMLSRFPVDTDSVVRE
jgi:hypothetical protein